MINLTTIPREVIEKILVHGGLAFIGGAAGYLSKEPSPKILMLLAKGLIGSFVGVVFGLVTCSITDSQYWQLAMAGMGGWFGNEGLEWLFCVIKNSITKIEIKPR